MKRNLLKLMLSLFAMAMFIGSCDEVVNQPEVDTDAVQDNAFTQSALSDVFSGIESGASIAKSATTCPIVTFEMAAGKLKLDYGTGCVGGGVNVKSGIIYAVITDYNPNLGWVNGTKAVLTLVDFKVDGKPLTGAITITCMVQADVKTFKIEAKEMALAYEDATKVMWSSTIYMSLKTVKATTKYWSISGTSTGTSRKGVAFSNTCDKLLTDPLCKYFLGGTLTITAGDNTDLITFGANCGSVTVKHNKLPEIPLTLI